MPRPVPPATLAAYARRWADRLERPVLRCDHPGQCKPNCPPPLPAHQLATELADALGARGYPAATLGTGSHGTSDSTSTERAALDPSPWAGIHETMARQLRDAWRALLDVEATLDQLLSHATDDDPIPAGQGPCQCGCGHVCRPRIRPDDRLRAGLAPACYQRWRRWRAAYPGHSRSDFIAACGRERSEAS